MTLTPDQQEAIMPAYLAAQANGGGLMCGIDRRPWDHPHAGHLYVRLRPITGDEKQALAKTLAKVREKAERQFAPLEGGKGQESAG